MFSLSNLRIPECSPEDQTMNKDEVKGPCIFPKASWFYQDFLSAVDLVHPIFLRTFCPLILHFLPFPIILACLFISASASTSPMSTISLGAPQLSASSWFLSPQEAVYAADVSESSYRFLPHWCVSERTEWCWALYYILFQCGDTNSSILLMQGLSSFHKTHRNFFMSEHFLFTLNTFEIRQCIAKFFRKTDWRNT